jgi:DNA-binding LacI/PurR family transcriptional regulator
MAEYLGLTTVVQPVVELGRIAAESLLAQMREGAAQPESTQVATQLVVRGSTGPVAGHRSTPSKDAR